MFVLEIISVPHGTSSKGKTGFCVDFCILSFDQPQLLSGFGKAIFEGPLRRSSKSSFQFLRAVVVGQNSKCKNQRKIPFFELVPEVDTDF